MSTRSTCRTSTPAASIRHERLPRHPGGLHLPERSGLSAAARITGCNVPTQFYEYHTNPERWSDELRLASKPGGRFHWLVGLYWEKTRDKNSGSTLLHAGTAATTARRSRTTTTTGLTHGLAARGPVVRVHRRARTTCRPPSSPISASTSPTSSTSKPAPCTSIPTSSTTAPTASSPTRRPCRALAEGDSHKWNSQLRDQLQVHRQGAWSTRCSRRASATAAPIPADPAELLQQRRAATTTSPTRSTITSSAGRRTSLERPADLERRDLLHGLEAVADDHLRPRRLCARAATT